MTSRGSTRSEEDVSDEALLAGMAAADDRAALVFVRRYQRRLFGLARAIVGDATLAEDIAQEALVRIFRHAVMFDARRGTRPPDRSTETSLTRGVKWSVVVVAGAKQPKTTTAPKSGGAGF